MLHLYFFQPLGSSDYCMLAQIFHTVIINDVPQLTLKNKSLVRRFIMLMDTLYDNRVSIIFFKMIAVLTVCLVLVEP